MNQQVDVIIPVYRPDNSLRLLLQNLQKQTFVVQRVIFANTEESLWEDYWKSQDQEEFFRTLPFEITVFHVSREEFNHGGTRAQAVTCSDAPYFICLTQDAMPADDHLVEELLKPLIQGEAEISYGRQLPQEDCQIVERYTRHFNYPQEGRRKGREDLLELGIKTYFCSNVCAAYTRRIYDELGGFEKHTIFNEDMILAGHAVQAGYHIAYVPEAQVIHSHNYSGIQQFHRNFDLAVSQQQHPEVFEGVSSQSEGIRMVKKTAKYLLTIKKPWLIVDLIWKSGWKYLGYRMGCSYQRLSRGMILRCTMNRPYWNQIWNRDEEDLDR